MKHIVQLTPKQLSVNDLIDENHIGFLSNNNLKGYIVKIAHPNGEDYLYSAICSTNGTESEPKGCNSTFGESKYSLKESINQISDCSIDYQIAILYLFDTRKELYKWLAE